MGAILRSDFSLGWMPSADLLLRFKAKIAPESQSGCWMWIGAVLHRGYGAFKLDRATVRAHRFSWLIHFGTIPKGLNVLHRCDAPLCVNPQHLFLGTQSDNMRDMRQKGRGKTPRLRMERHPMAKINMSIAEEIRAKRREGATEPELMREYAVARTTITDVCRGKRWVQ